MFVCSCHILKQVPRKFLTDFNFTLSSMLIGLFRFSHFFKLFVMFKGTEMSWALPVSLLNTVSISAGKLVAVTRN